MELLADENIRQALVATLRQEGHDVMWIAEECPRAPDADVFDLAVSHNRILITFDLDFADILYRQRRTGLRGLILVRIDFPDHEAVTRAVLDLWPLVAQWEGMTTVLEPGRVRQRALP